MPKFRVTNTTSYVIEADTPEEAMEQAIGPDHVEADVRAELIEEE